jgi:AAA family ATP:ADP antiporter
MFRGYTASLRQHIKHATNANNVSVKERVTLLAGTQDTVKKTGWLKALGIRPQESSLVALLFSNMFMSGLAIGMIRVCAFTLFLEKFGSDQLAVIAILLAFTGTFVTILLGNITRSFSVNGYLTTVISTIIIGLISFRFLLEDSSHDTLIFCLPLFFEVVYMLFSLQFVSLISRLLNVRQTKRLSGITRSGEFLAEIVGGLSIVVLLNYMAIEDLLVVAMFATLGVLAIVQFTVRKFHQKLIITSDDLIADKKEDRIGALLKRPYVRLISLCYAGFIFAYFFLDVAFYDYATRQYPNETDLAAFIGQFFATAGLITLITMVFLFAPFLRKFGMLGGMIAFPIVIGLGSIAISAMELTGTATHLIFFVMVFTNGMRFVLQSAIWRPSVAILFQVLPDRQRAQGTALIEGIVDPISGGIAGLCLYLLTSQLGWAPKYFLLLLAVIMVVWIAVSTVIRKMYLSNLLINIQKRKLGELSLQELDPASLNIIKDGLNSPYTAEIFYCLNLLEEIDHPEITELVKTTLVHENEAVRIDALNRISRLQLKTLTLHVRKLIDSELDPSVLGQALKTYSSLKPSDTIEVLRKILDLSSPDVGSGALVGILDFDAGYQPAIDLLLTMGQAPEASTRTLSAKIIGEIGSTEFSHYLAPMLNDSVIRVVRESIFAAGKLKDPDLLAAIVSHISNPNFQGAASIALRQYGDSALYELEANFNAKTSTRQEKIRVIDIVRDIDAQRSREFLIRHLKTQNPEIRHALYLALASIHYQADADDKYLFVNFLDFEVKAIARLLAANIDLDQETEYAPLRDALSNELRVRLDNMLLIVSFLFPSIVMLESRANIDSKVADHRVFALEVLDALLSPDIKQIVIPLLDDIPPRDQLEALNTSYPQRKLNPEARFEDLVKYHSNHAFFWTKASLLHQIGKGGNSSYLAFVIEELNNEEPIVRETAVWALAQLNPKGLQQMLTAKMQDPNPAVAAIVAELISALPTPNA